MRLFGLASVLTGVLPISGCGDDERPSCGDGKCDVRFGESPGSCAEDCFFGCGNGVCEAERGETVALCPDDCGWEDLSVGIEATCATKRDGSVWCWGNNRPSWSFIGCGVDACPTPTLKPDLDGVIDVAVSYGSGCALQGAVGFIWCWGDNLFGQLGTAAMPESDRPIEVQLSSAAASLASGESASCAMLRDGSVECWGEPWVHDAIGGLPLRPFLAEPARAIAVSRMPSLSSACAVTDEGNVQCWGHTIFGLTGGTEPPVPCVQGSPECFLVPRRIEGLAGVRALSLGHAAGCAVNADGHLYCWGLTVDGVLAVGDATSVEDCRGAPCTVLPVEIPGLDEVTQVSVGVGTACAVRADGTVWCWGGSERIAPGGQDHPALLTELENATQVSVGTNHACALVPGGVAKCWGRNDKGQLGLGEEAVLEGSGLRGLGPAG